MRTYSTMAAAVLTFVSTATVTAQDAAARAISAARAGGVTVVCRHAITDQDHREVEPVDYDDPSTQRRLSAEGDRQSEALGAAFRKLGIRTTEVIASPMQRARRTAELMFGRADIDSAWHTNGSDYRGPAREARLRTLRRPIDGVRVIVSHIGTMGSVLPGIERSLTEGDCVVVRPAAGTFDIVGTVPWRAWLRAAEQSGDHVRAGLHNAVRPRVLRGPR